MASEQQTAEDNKEMWTRWQNVDGIYMPGSVQPSQKPWKERLTNLRQMKLRDDDVFICAYPKAGESVYFQTVKCENRRNAELFKSVQIIDLVSVHLTVTLDMTGKLFNQMML